MTTTDPIADGEMPLDEIVRGVAGVSALYRSGGALQKLAASGAQALGLGEQGPLVRSQERNGRVVVTATIGVDAGSAADTCRAVHDAIAAQLRRRGVEGAAIAVTVAYVAE